MSFWRRREKELNEEVQSHLEMAARDRVERGEAQRDAESATRKEFGNVELVKTAMREQWDWRELRDLGDDVRFGARMLVKSPAFTIVAVLTLAVGIGGNATVFSWIRAVLLNPLPGVQNSQQIAAIETVMPTGEYHTSSYPDWKDYRERNHSFSDIVGFEFVGADINVRSAEPVERVWGTIATENYFDLLGVQAALGRTFHEEPNQGPKSNPYIVLGDSFWRRRFGANPAVLGQTVHINSHPFTVIGVAPASFRGSIVGIDSQYFVPMLMQPEVLPGESLTDRNPTFVHMAGRLRPGVRIEQAQAEMATLAEHLAKEHPEVSKGVGIYVAPVWKAHYGVQDFLRSVLGFLMVAAAFVLLIACINVANLLLARGTSREEEMAVRAALGASRGRLVRQLLIESLLLAGIGASFGILLAMWGTKLLAAFAPPAHLPILLSVGIDSSVMLFTLGVTVITGVLFGLMPAWRGSRADLNTALKEGGQRAGRSVAGQRLRDALVISEMVMATVLLVVGGLLVRSVRNAQSTGPGFRTDQITLAAFDLRANGYDPTSTGPAFFDQLTEKLQSMPGVESVSMERYVPLWFTGRSYSPIQVEGYAPQPEEDMNIDLNVVGANYFQTLDVPLMAGRDFSAHDRDGAPYVVIVNQTMANRFWAGKEAVGHRIRLWGTWWTVTGVARDVKYHRINEPPQPFLYLPELQAGGADVNVLVRSHMPTSAVVGAVRVASRSIDAKIQPLETDDLRSLLDASLFANRTAANVATILGGLGLLLAAIGTYGVLSYLVAQRTRDIGIRMALGASPARVLGHVLGYGIRLTAAGLGVGVAASFLGTRVIASLLYGVHPADGLTFSAASIVLAVVALTASYVPARRAAKVDPIVALRHE